MIPTTISVALQSVLLLALLPTCLSSKFCSCLIVFKFYLLYTPLSTSLPFLSHTFVPFLPLLQPSVTIQCIIAELEGLGGELTGAIYMAKRFQLRHCGHHKKDPVCSSVCVKHDRLVCLKFQFN